MYGKSNCRGSQEFSKGIVVLEATATYMYKYMCKYVGRGLGSEGEPKSAFDQ